MQWFSVIGVLTVLAMFGWMETDAWAAKQISEGGREISTKTEHYQVIDIDGKQVKHGQYTQFHPSGEKMIQGAYRNGEKDGRWLFQTKQGVVYKEENYSSGKRHGQWIEWYANGKKSAEGTFENDRPKGTHYTWHMDGAVKSEVVYREEDGHVLAVKKTWHPDGKRYTQTEIKDGQPHGVEMRWHRNGNLSSQCIYDQGQRHGLCQEWYDNGQAKAEYTYDHGRKTGQSTEWYDNGQKSAQGDYAQGKEGLWTYWEKSGAIREQQRYVSGKAVKE